MRAKPECNISPRATYIVVVFTSYLCINYSPIYTRPLNQIKIRIKLIQFLCKCLNPPLIQIRIHILMWIKSGLHTL